MTKEEIMFQAVMGARRSLALQAAEATVLEITNDKHALQSIDLDLHIGAACCSVFDRALIFGAIVQEFGFNPAELLNMRDGNIVDWESQAAQIKDQFELGLDTRKEDKHEQGY